MAVSFRLRLNGKLQPLFQCAEAARLFFGPVGALVRRAQVGGVVAEVVAIDSLIARRGDDANLFNAARERFLGNDLEQRLGQPVAIDQGQHRLLHGIGRGVLPRASAGRSDHRLRNLHRSTLFLITARPYCAFAKFRRRREIRRRRPRLA